MGFYMNYVSGICLFAGVVLTAFPKQLTPCEPQPPRIYGVVTAVLAWVFFIGVGTIVHTAWSLLK